MALTRGKKNAKNPPFLSHEFVIQNHADIVSCVVMAFVIGLMFPTSAGLISKFVALQHNITINATETTPEITGLYIYGFSDVCAVFFYGLITIIVHAIIQEYIFDKLNRRMHLSKIKHSKFNESGQLLVYYALSSAASLYILTGQDFVTNISQLWEDYPHSHLPFFVKLFFILQISYWLHTYPELYFQRVKKDDSLSRLPYMTMYLFFICAAYLLNLTRVALIMLTLHFMVEFIFHTSRLLHFSEKDDLSSKGFKVWNVLFVLVRLVTVTLSVLTFWYGLKITTRPSIDWSSGNFNTTIVRINCLVATCLTQAWMMWNFINFHLKRMRERIASLKKVTSTPKKERQKKTKEADQNEATENGVRSRAKGKKN